MTSADGPLATIVMPVTKTRFLAAAIESALAQDYPHLEVLALDDGSSDPEMADLLAGFAARRPDRFRFERHDNIGQSATINRGLEMARGELAGYLSDDDLLHPDAISALVAVLAARPDAVVAYPNFEIIDEAGATIDSIVPLPYSRRDSARLHDSIVGAGAIFRVEAFRAIGGWDTSMRYRADYDFWLRIAALGPILDLRQELASWRYHAAGGSVAGAGLPMARESIRVIDKLYEDGEVEPELEEVRAEAYRNAFFQAAIATNSGIFGHGERFAVVDRHMPQISRAAREQQEEREAAARPWWWRTLKGATPRSLRPLARRTATRLRATAGR
jgi:hypothetical protein